MKRSLYPLLTVALLASCTAPPPGDYKGVVSFIQSVTPDASQGEGAPAPDFVWFDESGRKMSFKAMSKGKPALINFWNLNCGVCLYEMPDIKQVHAEYTPKGAIVLSVNDDTRDPPSLLIDQLHRFSEDWQLRFPVLVENEALGDHALWNAFGIRSPGRPVQVFIDKEGRIAKSISGSLKKEEFAAELDKLL